MVIFIKYKTCFMQLTGKNFIGNNLSAKGTTSFKADNPANSEALPENFFLITTEEVDEVTKKASAAFKIYQQKTAEEKALFLETIAKEILALGDDLISRAATESGLPFARLIVNATERQGNYIYLHKCYVKDHGLVQELTLRLQTANQYPNLT